MIPGGPGVKADVVVKDRDAAEAGLVKLLAPGEPGRGGGAVSAFQTGLGDAPVDEGRAPGDFVGKPAIIGGGLKVFEDAGIVLARRRIFVNPDLLTSDQQPGAALRRRPALAPVPQWPAPAPAAAMPA